MGVFCSIWGKFMCLHRFFVSRLNKRKNADIIIPQTRTRRKTMTSFKIVADSSVDIKNFPGVDFESVPLKIITAEREFCDDAKLDVSDMVGFLSTYKGRSSTSCPNPQDWISAFGDAENVFCITITSKLSGSYSSALVAKEIYEERHPGRRVFVFDSLSTGPEMKLIMENVRELYLGGAAFEEICSSAAEYSKKTGLFFLLRSMRNLANNGRVSQLVAKGAGLLGIRVLGKATDGVLDMLDKARGEEKALDTVIKRLSGEDFSGRKIRIAHCNNERAAKALSEKVIEKYPCAEIEIYTLSGLCSFYAEDGGILVGFEKN